MDKSIVTHKISRMSGVKMISAIAPWIQWLNMYALFSGVTVGYALIILLDLFYFVFFRKKKGVIRIGTQARWAVVFFAVSIVFLPVALLFADHFDFVLILNRFLKMGSLIVFIVILRDGVGLDWRVYRRSLEVLVAFSCLVVIYQFVSFSLMGRYYDIRIPFLNYANDSTNSLLSGVSTENRFRSIFTEPAYFVYFIFQYFPILLFDNADRSFPSTKQLVLAGIITICVVLSVSTTGLFLLALCWGTFFVTSIRRGRISKRGVALIFISITGLLFLIYYYLNNNILSFSSQRMMDSYSQSSVVWYRLSAGFQEIKEMTWMQRLMGYGLGNYTNDFFLNGVAYTILCTGLFGLAIVVCWMISNFINSVICGKVVTVIWVLLIITEIMALYSPTMIGYAVLINHYIKGRKRVDKENDTKCLRT